MKLFALLSIALCLAGCSSPEKMGRTLERDPQSAATGQNSQSVETEPAKSKGPGEPDQPAPSQAKQEALELPRFLVQGEFRMSFGFGVKILKEELTGKVMTMYVDGVDPDSDAGRKGLEPGARIMSIDGTPVTDFDATWNSGSELNRIFSARNRGAAVDLEVAVLGSGKTRTIHIIERPYH